MGVVDSNMVVEDDSRRKPFLLREPPGSADERSDVTPPAAFTSNAERRALTCTENSASSMIRRRGLVAELQGSGGVNGGPRRQRLFLPVPRRGPNLGLRLVEVGQPGDSPVGGELDEVHPAEGVTRRECRGPT